MTEIELRKENFQKLMQLRNQCIRILNEIIMDELKRSNDGKDPEYFPYVAAHYSLYIRFTTDLLHNLDTALRQFDDKLGDEKP
jgi:hypothetical protein